MNTLIKQIIKFIQINKSLSHFKKAVKKSTIIFVSTVKASHKIKTSVKIEIYTKSLNITLTINKMLSLYQENRAKLFIK